MISGAVTAFGSALNHGRPVTASVLFTVALGSLCAALLNAASNVINQVYDLPIDRINKPKRPLCTGEITESAAMRFAWVLYALALFPTWLVVDPYRFPTLSDKLWAPLPEHQCIWIYLAGLVFTFIYSAPYLGRTKRLGMVANITIAIPRGCLLKVAGWSMVASVLHVEPWFIGAIFLVFLLGAATTKDFSDMEGDRRGGCQTLPVRYGVARAAWMIAPFFVLPWLLIPIGVFATNPFGEGTILTGSRSALLALSAILTIWGAYTVWLMVRRPEELASTENHVSWTHMYLMMMAAQVGFLVAYLV